MFVQYKIQQRIKNISDILNLVIIVQMYCFRFDNKNIKQFTPNIYDNNSNTNNEKFNNKHSGGRPICGAKIFDMMTSFG